MLEERFDLYKRIIEHNGGKEMLEELLKIISLIAKETKDVDEISKNEAILSVDLKELTNKTDQEIDEFIKTNEKDLQKQEHLFSVFQKIKINQSIEVIEDEMVENQKVEEKRLLLELFSQLVTPDEIEITDEDVCIKYGLNSNSRLKEKIEEVTRWNRDNVIETISNKFNVPVENIIFIDSVSSYIDFISNFEENNYVSRG